MHIGDFLGHGATAFTPWIRRQADNAVFTFEVFDNPDSVDVEFKIYDKDLEEYGSGHAGSAFSTSGNFYSKDQAGLRELVRFKIAVGKPEEGEPVGTGVVYSMLEPTWYDTAEA